MIQKFGAEPVALVYDVQFHEVIIKMDLADNISICPPHPPNENTAHVDCGRKWPAEMDENWMIVYVG